MQLDPCASRAKRSAANRSVTIGKAVFVPALAHYAEKNVPNWNVKAAFAFLAFN
jgi:hypothetical protein